MATNIKSITILFEDGEEQRIDIEPEAPTPKVKVEPKAKPSPKKAEKAEPKAEPKVEPKVSPEPAQSAGHRDLATGQWVPDKPAVVRPASPFPTPKPLVSNLL